MFNSSIGNTSISQQSVRSGMNATTANGAGFGASLNMSLQSQQPRNSVVGGRHIPIAKFSRGHTRGRQGNNGGEGGGNKRITQINFYQSTGQAAKLKEALDMSLQSNPVTSDSPNLMASGPNSIFVGSAKPGTAYGNGPGVNKNHM